MAESDTGIIDALTDWVVGAAVDAYQVLAELGVSVPIAVKCPTLNLHDLTVPDRLEQRLRGRRHAGRASVPGDHRERGVQGRCADHGYPEQDG